MNIRYIAISLAIIGVVIPSHATLPKLEPFGNAFERFREECVPQLDGLARDLRALFSKNDQSQPKEVDSLERYLRNIRADDIPGVQRAIAAESNELVAKWLRRVSTDLVGFRRIVDHLVIMNLANNGLRLEQGFQTKLQRFWDDEEYFTWRFIHEADLRMKKPSEGVRF